MKVGTGFPQSKALQVHNKCLINVFVGYNKMTLLDRVWKNNEQYIVPSQQLNAREDVHVDEPAGTSKTKYFRLVTSFRNSLTTATTFFREQLQMLI